jgi:hypothetical protein
LAANHRLATAYVLKDDLKHPWDYTYAGAARRFFNERYHRAIRSRIEPLKAFARNLKHRLQGSWPIVAIPCTRASWKDRQQDQGAQAHGLLDTLDPALREALGTSTHRLDRALARLNAEFDALAQTCGLQCAA